jgi:catechol-2,3-dioxygenase
MLLTDLTIQVADPRVAGRFFNERLGLRAIDDDASGTCIQAGRTAIRLDQAHPGAAGQSFYHLAFNIPENKLEAAIDWMAGRAELLPIEGANGPIADFTSWNAHAIYFLDPAGNILELIARHGLANAAPGPFASRDILCVSEVGIVTPDVPQTAAQIRATFNLKSYGSPSREFEAIGDEQGLFIVVQAGRPWFPGRVRPAEIHPMAITIRGAAPGELAIPEAKCVVRSP